MFVANFYYWYWNLENLSTRAVQCPTFKRIDRDFTENEFLTKLSLKWVFISRNEQTLTTKLNLVRWAIRLFLWLVFLSKWRVAVRQIYVISSSAIRQCEQCLQFRRKLSSTVPGGHLNSQLFCLRFVCFCVCFCVRFCVRFCVCVLKYKNLFFFKMKRCGPTKSSYFS